MAIQESLHLFFVDNRDQIAPKFHIQPDTEVADDGTIFDPKLRQQYGKILKVLSKVASLRLTGSSKSTPQLGNWNQHMDKFTRNLNQEQISFEDHHVVLSTIHERIKRINLPRKSVSSGASKDSLPPYPSRRRRAHNWYRDKFSLRNITYVQEDGLISTYDLPTGGLKPVIYRKGSTDEGFDVAKTMWVSTHGFSEEDAAIAKRLVSFADGVSQVALMEDQHRGLGRQRLWSVDRTRDFGERYYIGDKPLMTIHNTIFNEQSEAGKSVYNLGDTEDIYPQKPRFEIHLEKAELEVLMARAADDEKNFVASSV